MARTRITPLAKGRRPRVVVVGTGHAGMEVVHGLRRAPVDVLLVDRNNYHKFQPLLYQVATSGLSPSDITQATRHIFAGQENFSFRMARVEGVDFDGRMVHIAEGDPIAYDHLVLAAGASTSFFGVPGAARYAFPLKNVSDAINLRGHIFERFEAADSDPAAIRAGAINFVIVGGGPTGVEMAGALRELFDHVLRRDFPRLDIARARVMLLEMGPTLLAPYHPRLRQYTEKTLRQRGVEVRFGATVSRVGPRWVELVDGEVIPAHTLVWAAGVRANPLADALGLEQEADGRVVVDETLRLAGRPEVFVIGDMAAARDEEGLLYPQLAPVAIQQGRFVARMLDPASRRRQPGRFVYRDRGMMATIGRNAAVAQFPGGRTLRGRAAWLTWVMVHIVQLVGFRNQASVLLNWVYNYFTWDRGPRLVLVSYPEADALDARDPRSLLVEGPPHQSEMQVRPPEGPS